MKSTLTAQGLKELLRVFLDVLASLESMLESESVINVFEILSYLGHVFSIFFGIYWAYLWHTLDISWTYREHISGISWTFAYLIFVTDTTDGVCGEKLVMWRNSPRDMLSSGKFLHMINVKTNL